MINWDLSDEQLRSVVVGHLQKHADEMTFQAEREERALAERTVPTHDRRESEACARYSRKQAAHYQQAIYLLTAAPMPASEEEK